MKRVGLGRGLDALFASEGGAGAAMREALKGLDYSHSLRVLVKRGFIGADTNGRAGRTLRVPGHDSQRLYEVTPALLSAPLD